MQEIILLTCELLSALIPFLLAFIAYVHTQKTRGAGLNTGTTILVVVCDRSFPCDRCGNAL